MFDPQFTICWSGTKRSFRSCDASSVVPHWYPLFVVDGESVTSADRKSNPV